jgi:DNA-binding MarR family transcriptional regulator
MVMRMGGLDVEQTLARLAALQPQILGAVVERRAKRPDGGPTRLQEFALLAIRDRRGMQVSELSALLETSAATTSQLLTAMEERGWLRREMLPEDRRRHQVTLTAAGAEMVQQMERRRRERFARVLGELSGEERAQFVALAGRLVEIVTRGFASAGEVL